MNLESIDHLKNLQGLANLIKESSRIVILTGAGMDTESNLPDFRSDTGLWKTLNPIEMSHVDTFLGRYDAFQDFYKSRLLELDKSVPHEGHRVLARLEKNKDLVILTQNVSGLHRLAGSTKVLELHGSLSAFYCHTCSVPVDKDAFLNKENCHLCHTASLRPDIVLFGENLPVDVWDAAMDYVQRSDLFLVIGTSLTVYPVNQMGHLAPHKKVYINGEVDYAKHLFDLCIEGRIEETLIALETLL
jgi:NAD-dependent deacetylase